VRRIAREGGGAPKAFACSLMIISPSAINRLNSVIYTPTPHDSTVRVIAHFLRSSLLVSDELVSMNAPKIFVQSASPKFHRCFSVELSASSKACRGKLGGAQISISCVVAEFQLR
jgi:hypothetical protein